MRSTSTGRMRTSSTWSARRRSRWRPSTWKRSWTRVPFPLRYAGYSTCFRREAGSYGKDLGGMFRVHQFDKVEMFSFATPESSWDEHEFLVSIEEEIIGGLGIPYRIVNIAAGDLGGAAAKKYDLEAWLPGRGATASSLVLELHRLRCPPGADAGASSGRIGGDAPHAQRNGHGDRPDPRSRSWRTTSKRTAPWSSRNVSGSSCPNGRGC